MLQNALAARIPDIDIVIPLMVVEEEARKVKFVEEATRKFFHTSLRAVRHAAGRVVGTPSTCPTSQARRG